MAAGLEPEFVKLAALPRFQWAIPALESRNLWLSSVIQATDRQEHGMAWGHRGPQDRDIQRIWVRTLSL
jgi:hypothetical protein